MSKIEKAIEVEAPIRAVYNQWTQFEEFPRFMQGIKRIEQKDDTHLHWSAEIGGKDLEWDAEIVDQIPDQRISWRSTTGKRNAGTVRFEKIGENRTRVMVEMEYEPQGAVENVGDAVGVPSHRVEGDLKRFKEFIEKMGHETGGWRGEVHEGRRSSRGDSGGGMGGMSAGGAAAATHSGMGAGGSTGGGMGSAGGAATSGATGTRIASDVGERTPGGSGGTATGRTGNHKDSKGGGSL